MIESLSALVLIASYGMSPIACSPAPSPEPVSVLVITMDTTRSDVLFPGGDGVSPMPHIARLAGESTVFTHAFTQTNVTNPSHVSLFTGLRAKSHGVFDNRTAIPASIETVPERFKKAGFFTAAFPAVPHLSDVPRWRGFDHFQPAERELKADEVTSRVLRWSASHALTMPVFVWVHYYDPHAPYVPPARIVKRYYRGDPFQGHGPRLIDHRFFRDHPTASSLADWIGDVRDPAYPRALYRGEVAFVDQEIGRLLDVFERRFDPLLVVLTADHGESIDEHGIFFSHEGLYQTQIHIPLIIRLPRRRTARVVDAPVSLLDIAPTLEAMFNLPSSRGREGASLLPWLEGRKPSLSRPRRLIVEHAHNHEAALIDGDWKLIWPVEDGILYLPNHPLLFNLSDDPREEHDLSSDRKDVVARMKKRLEPWIRLGQVQPRALERREAEDKLRALGYAR